MDRRRQQRVRREIETAQAEHDQVENLRLSIERRLRILEREFLDLNLAPAQATQAVDPVGFRVGDKVVRAKPTKEEKRTGIKAIGTVVRVTPDLVSALFNDRKSPGPYNLNNLRKLTGA